MKRAFAMALILVFALLLPAAADEDSLQDFTRTSSPVERDWETKFRAIPSPDNEREYMRRLSAYPHHVGSPYDKDNAEWILAQFKSWGWDAHIETFDVLFPTPKERLVELVEPTKFTAKLQEPPVPGDPTSNQQSQQLPTYNAYSADGDVTAPLVYVNFGVPEDYDQLARLGVSVKGAIVIARYWGAWRGIKPKVAAEHGAVGCIIYSDPHDDGYFEGDVYPKGPMRPPDGVQRGSVMDFPSTSPGDPLTPGHRRHARRQAPPDQGRARHHEDSDPSHFLRRCTAPARRVGRADGARRLARLVAHSVSRGRGSHESPSGRESQLGHQADL